MSDEKKPSNFMVLSNETGSNRSIYSSLKSSSQSSNRKSSNRIRIFSQDSVGCSSSESTGTVGKIVKNITKNPKTNASLTKVAPTTKSDLLNLSALWRGWIILSETKPIVLFTSDLHMRKERVEVDNVILQKVVTSVMHFSSDPSASVLSLKNVKLKVKQCALTDLEQYGSTLHQVSGSSLCKGAKIGSLATKANKDTYAELKSKYNLPDVYKEEGSQASSTDLRIFKATVTLKSQPTCSLNEKSRERLFLMFSPSDDNVLDLINNSQIKNKILRHEIGKFLKVRKRETKDQVTKLTNLPLFTRRHLPSLAPVKDLGNLAKMPQLTIEKIYEIFFKENVIEKDGYSILVKEQPLLIENITLCVIPKAVPEIDTEAIVTKFVPRYSYKDREGDEVSESEAFTKQSSTLKSAQPSQILSEEKPESISVEPSNSFIIKSVVQDKLTESPLLKDNLEKHLIRLYLHLRQKAETASETDVLPTVLPEMGETTESGQFIPKNLKSKWDKFEFNKGEKAKIIKEQVDKTFKEINKFTEEVPEVEEKRTLLTDERATRGSTTATISSLLSTTVISQEATEITPNEEELEESIFEGNRLNLQQILQQIRDNYLNLKKEIIPPIIKPELPTHLLTGRKKIYINEFQKYWTAYHTDVSKFYHNPLEQHGHVCRKPIINSDWVGTMPFSTRDTPEEASIKSSSTGDPSNIVSGGTKEPHVSDTFSLNQEAKDEKLDLQQDLPPIITTAEVDEVKHELGNPEYTYAKNKNAFAGLAPSKFYKNSKKEIVALSYCHRFLKNYYSRYEKRRKLFMCIENEYGVQKIVSSTIKPTGLPFKELGTWKAVAKYISQNVTYLPLENPLFLPHVLSSPSTVLERGSGNPFEISNLLASLLLGQGYDVYVVSGYANVLLTMVESSRNYLRYECPFLISEAPTDPFQTFNTTSYVVNTIERSKKPEKKVSNYKPSVAPYLDSAYIRQTKIDKEKEKEEESIRIAREDEENACNRYLSLFEADDLEGKRIHSWIVVLPGKRNVETAFFIEPSSGLSYSIDDPHYYGIESIWNDQNYWIYRHYEPFFKKEVTIEEVGEIKEGDEEVKHEEENRGKEVKEKPILEFDLANNQVWLPLLINGPQMFKEKEERGKKKDMQNKLLRLQKSLDMPTSWCSRISITTNKVEQRINKQPFCISVYKRALCYEYQSGYNDDGLVAKITRFSDLPRTDPEYDVQVFEKRRDFMYRRRREIISDKLTEYFAFGRDDCLKSHEFIAGADAMYCDHNIFFYWDYRDDGLKSIHMTDLYLKLDYGGRKDNLFSILVIYGATIEEGKKSKRKGAEPGESGKTPRKEIQTIIQEFHPSSHKTPWTDFAKITFRITKNETLVDYQFESQRVTVTTKVSKKRHDDSELGQAVAEIAKRKRNRDDDEDAQSEIDLEKYDKDLDIESDIGSSDAGSRASSKFLSNPSLSDRKKGRGNKMKSSNNSISTKKSGKDKEQESLAKKGRSSGKPSSEESVDKSTRSSLSEGSFGLSDMECSSASEKEHLSFYPNKLVADKDKSLWACNQENKKIMKYKLLSLLSKKDKSTSIKNHSSHETTNDQSNLDYQQSAKNKEFGHLTKDSSAESSDEDEEFMKELKKRQFKAINETKEVYKAIERDEANPNISSLIRGDKSKNYQLCKLENILELVDHTEEDRVYVERMKNKLVNSLHKESYYFPNESVPSKLVKTPNTNIFHFDHSGSMDECINRLKDNQKIDDLFCIRKTDQCLNDKAFSISETGPGNSNLLLDSATRNTKSNKHKVEKQNNRQNQLDPLIVGIYKDNDRCLDDPLNLKKKRSMSKAGSKLGYVFANNVTEDVTEEMVAQGDESETQSISFRKGEGTLSEEEVANEKDIDSIEGDIYNSDDNYSLQSKNASSDECLSSEGDIYENDASSEASFSCQSEHASIIEYQTEAPNHEPYDFKGFHFQAGKMYARKLYQLKEVCDLAAIDSDQQSSYEGDENYDVPFLEGEIHKFLENTVDKLSQNLREARNLIGGLKKGSDTNLNIEQTGVYYCNLSDKYINYVDSYFKKINKKREMQSDKALMMEILKQRAKEPDKIIKHIREYMDCKKKGTTMELDEALMNLIPHVRPVEAKKKDRLGYEILTEDDDDEETKMSKSAEEVQTIKPETQRESIEPENITLVDLLDRMGDSPNVMNLIDSLNNLKKFKDMETVNQLISLPLHECFSDVNIRNHLQSSKVNDGYFIDANVGGKVCKEDGCQTDLGFVTDPEHILLSKDIESVNLSLPESDLGEQEVKLKHMEISTPCGKETVKEADFYDPIYSNNAEDKANDPFRLDKFRMFVPLEPAILDSDSDGSINKRIKDKRRKAFKKKPDLIDERGASVTSISTIFSNVSTVTATNMQQRLDIDRTFGLEPLQAAVEICRVGVKNMSVNDEVSNFDKAVVLQEFLAMEDDTVDYIRNLEAYINNLLILRRKERQSTKRSILRASRKGIRRANFKVLKQKLDEFNSIADLLSFDWDLILPYFHLLLPEDGNRKFTASTSNYIIRCLIVDFTEKELFKLKGLYETYEKARQHVLAMKNLYMSELEHMSFTEKNEYEKVVTKYNESLRQIADRAHVLRFVIIRRAKISTKRFLKLINEIKNDERIKDMFSKSKERLLLMDLSRRWPEHFEFVTNFSGLPVASEPNDFTTSYLSPIDDIIIRKILKQVRKKPAKYILNESTYDRYLELMDRDREYFEGLKKKEVAPKKKRSIHSIYLGDKIDFSYDGKNSDFIDKLEIINDLVFEDFFFASDSEDEIVQQPRLRSMASSNSVAETNTAFNICSKSLLEELILIREIESSSRVTKDSSSHTGRRLSFNLNDFENEQEKKDAMFFAKYGTHEAAQQIQEKLPEYFEYI